MALIIGSNDTLFTNGFKVNGFIIDAKCDPVTINLLPSFWNGTARIPATTYTVPSGKILVITNLMSNGNGIRNFASGYFNVIPSGGCSPPCYTMTLSKPIFFDENQVVEINNPMMQQHLNTVFNGYLLNK